MKKKLILRSDGLFVGLLILATASFFWPVHATAWLVLTGEAVNDVAQFVRHLGFAILYSLVVGLGMWRLAFYRDVIWMPRRAALLVGLSAALVLMALQTLHLSLEFMQAGGRIRLAWFFQAQVLILCILTLMYMLPLSVFLMEQLKRRYRLRVEKNFDEEDSDEIWYRLPEGVTAEDAGIAPENVRPPQSVAPPHPRKITRPNSE